jgi:predicted Zn-dependent protease
VRYGLIRAQMRAGRLDDADAGLKALRRDIAPSAFIETLAAELAMARRDAGGAVRILDAATRRFPASQSLRYALADAQIIAGRPADAVVGVRQELQTRGEDIRLWQLLSRANADLGKRTAQHRAQAEVYALQGSYPAAVEQLEIARKAGDGDFYELSAVDARLRELKVRVREERRERGLER